MPRSAPSPDSFPHLNTKISSRGAPFAPQRWSDPIYEDDALLCPIAIHAPEGAAFRCVYDGLYRLVAVADPEGFVTRSEYDPNGNRTALVDGNGHRAAFTYDPLDRLETVTNPEGETIRHVYDPVGNQTLRIEPDGVVTRYDYDGVYRLAAVTLNHRPGAPADRQTNVAYRYHYDPAGNRVQVDLPPNAAALTRTLHYEYDSLHRLVAETDPPGNTWRYAYDPAGNRVRRVDPAGRVTTYTYDADNLLVRIAYDDGLVIAFAYDENHNRTAMTDTLGVSRWAYDPLNRVVEATDSLGRRLRYAYDPAGNRVALTLPEGGVLRYDYDASNRLREVTDPERRRTRFERDGVGNLVRQVNPNGTVTEASYDRANRLRSLTTRRMDGTVIAAFAYEVNEVGLRTVMTATYGWRNPPVVTERYTYDPLRRLTGVTDSEGFRAVYEYDAAGNRTRWWANDDRTTPRPRDGFEVTYTYDAADQLLQALRVGAQPNDRQAFVYAYDANGNRVNLNWPGPPGPDTQGMDYVYDREGRLIVAQAYQTNHRGQRVDREVTRLFYDGLGRRLVKEYDPKDGSGGVKRTEYVLDDRDPVVEYFIWNGQREEFYRGGVEAFSPTPMLLVMRHFPAGAEGQAYWVHLDGRGSVAGITQHLGQSTHNYRYDAFGQVLPAEGNWTDPHNHYTFLGKEWDEHLGLYEFGVRLYDPWAGVWLTREPLPGDAWEPRTWHRYGYAFANPISYYDPYGMQAEPPITPVPVPTPPPYTPVPRPSSTPCPFPMPGLTPAPQPVPTPLRTLPPTPMAVPVSSSQPRPAGASPCSGPWTRWPDYWTFNVAVGYAFEGAIGIGGSAYIDRYGRFYLAGAPLSLGEGLPFVSLLASANLSAGWLCQIEAPSREELQGFLTGWGATVNIGAVIGLGVSESGERKAMEFGLYSPQVGGSRYHSWLIADLPSLFSVSPAESYPAIEWDPFWGPLWGP
jgi:RHS repeat-associated protein